MLTVTGEINKEIADRLTVIIKTRSRLERLNYTTSKMFSFHPVAFCGFCLSALWLGAIYFPKAYHGVNKLPLNLCLEAAGNEMCSAAGYRGRWLNHRKTGHCFLARRLLADSMVIIVTATLSKIPHHIRKWLLMTKDLIDYI